MTTATHIMMGVTLGSVLATINSTNPVLSGKEIILLTTVISVLPDANIIANRKLTTHHSDYSHYPITALVISVVVFVVELFFGASFVFTQIIFFALALHYLMDTFGHTIGVHWLYPFDKREFSFTKLRRELKEHHIITRSVEAVKGPVMKSEVIVWCMCVATLVIIYLVH